MPHDEQDDAEAVDEDMIGGDDLLSEPADVQFPPDHPVAIQFADADITDESISDRVAQEEPEISERDIDERDADG